MFERLFKRDIKNHKTRIPELKHKKKERKERFFHHPSST